jgi:hypothetical protein
MNINHYSSHITGFQSCFNDVASMFADKNTNVGIINWWWLSKEEAQIENLKQFVESQDICFFVSEEIFDRHNDVDMNKVFAMLNLHNVYYILFSHDFTLDIRPDLGRTYCNPWFFKSPVYVPSKFIPDLDYVDKPYAFNLLLGSNKSYRTLAYKILKYNHNVYSKYLGHPDFKINSITNLDDEEIYTDLTTQDVVHYKLNTMNFVEREHNNYPISHVVPEKIYANTHFDIVTETFVKHQHMFITEKTAKPLATGRFFCWFNSNNVVNYLEKFGFDFTNYDAEYDNLHNDVDRLNAMLCVAEEIARNPLYIKDIYKKTKNVRVHNMEVFKQNTVNFRNRLTEWVIQCLNR